MFDFHLNIEENCKDAVEMHSGSKTEPTRARFVCPTASLMTPASIPNGKQEGIFFFFFRSFTRSSHHRPTAAAAAAAMVLTCLSHSTRRRRSLDASRLSLSLFGCVGRARLKSSPLLPAYRQVAREMGLHRTAASPSPILNNLFHPSF